MLQRASERERTCKQAVAIAFAPIEPVINSPHEACQRVAELQPRVQGRREPLRRTSRRAVDVAFVLDEDSNQRQSEAIRGPHQRSSEVISSRLRVG